MVDCDFNNCNRKKIYIYIYMLHGPQPKFLQEILFTSNRNDFLADFDIP